MATVDTSELRGLAAELERDAARIGRESSAQIRKTAAKVEATAKDLVPVGTDTRHGHRPGTLRDSISTQLKGTGNSGKMLAIVGPTEHYGFYVEYGTARTEDQPFLAPALKRHKADYESAMDQLAAKIID